MTMKPEEAISRMIAPGQVRPLKGTKGVIQIHVTRQCDKACFNCTQGSNLRGPYYFMPPDLFAKAVGSLKSYWGIVGLFGGNPALHPDFLTLCDILRSSGIPRERLGIWCNHPIREINARDMAITFNPSVSNLNCHLDQKAFDLFKKGWPKSMPFGLTEDSRHSPVFVSMNDLDDMTEDEKWEAISRCEINQRWSASIGMFRGKLRAWFCEIAMAQSIINEHDTDYPDTGLDPTILYQVSPEGTTNPQGSITSYGTNNGLYRTTWSEPKHWWELPITSFRNQIKHHCLNCAVPLRGYGSLAQASDSEGVEYTSETYSEVYESKRVGRTIKQVKSRSELDSHNLPFIDYLGGARK